VRVLLDTHALLWALADSPRLSRRAREVIEDAEHEVLVSAVSGWEIAIKRAQGRLDAPTDLLEAIRDAGFRERPIRLADARHLATLPPHHRDPFDRMLVAQALADGVPLVSCDRALAPYPIQVLW